MRVVHWFRNDLRLRDNTALAVACARASELIPLFVVDPVLLRIHHGAGRRQFLARCLAELADALARRGCPLRVCEGAPAVAVRRVLESTRPGLLTFNRDQTPYGRRRDAAVHAAARRAGVAVAELDDRAVMAPNALRTAAGGAFRVYGPFRRRWWARYREDPPSVSGPARLPRGGAGTAPDLARHPGGVLAALTGGAASTPVQLPAAGEAAAHRRLEWFIGTALRDYARDRDRPGIDGTSRLSPYLRAGAISARECVAAALGAAAEEPRLAAGARRWVDELIWRDFYLALLAEHGRMLRAPLRPEYRHLEWNDDAAGLRAWQEGRTGYPMVDAAMRQLAHEGWMHNRARMVAASFLTKDLLIDWRRGERVFLRDLIDGDPAANNGGWQWVASTGTDAQPYFRIFNPVLQGERFDPDGGYVRAFLPELRDVATRWVHRPWEAPTPPRDYPPPIVDHAERRIAAVARYEAARARNRSDRLTP